MAEQRSDTYSNSTRNKGEFERKPIDGVKLIYCNYSSDLYSSKRVAKPLVFGRHSLFDIDFKESEAVALPGLMCELTLKTASIEASGIIQVQFAGIKNFAIGQVTPEHQFLGIQILYRSEYKDAVPFVTSISFDGLSPPAETRFSRNFHLASPVQHSPNWSTQWILNRNQMKQVIADVRRKKIDLTLGYWLDDKVVRYTALNPNTVAPVDDFEKCLRTNNLN